MTKNKCNLKRFVDAQKEVYDDVVLELKSGCKRSHWIWFIFPQLKGLGRSQYSYYYGLDNLDEALAYTKDKLLWPRYLECCNILLELNGYTIYEIMGFTDATKLRSSLTLFCAVSNEQVLRDLLNKYYDGEKCSMTLKLLNK